MNRLLTEPFWLTGTSRSRFWPGQRTCRRSQRGPLHPEHGQATLELIASSTLLLLTLTLGGIVLRAEWDRTECARWVFEVARKKLEGSAAPAPPPSIHIEVREDPDAWTAEGQCGQSHETIQLKKLGDSHEQS